MGLVCRSQALLLLAWTAHSVHPYPVLPFTSAAPPAAAPCLQVEEGPAGSAQHAEHARLQAAASGLAARLEEAMGQYGAWASQRAAAEAAAAAARAVVSLEDLFGPESEGEGEEAGPAAAPQREQQEQQRESSAAAVEQQEQPAAAAAARGELEAEESEGRQQQEEQQEGGAAAEEGAELLPNPYESFRDPAAPKKRPDASSAQQAAPGAGAGAASAPPRPLGVRSSSLPDSVRRALAEKVRAGACVLGSRVWA